MRHGGKSFSACVKIFPYKPVKRIARRDFGVQKRFSMRVTFLYPLLAFVTCFFAPAGTALVISGSDLFGSEVEEALSDGLKEAGIEVEITFDGSLLGLRDLENGAVDVSLLAQPPGRDDGTELRQFPVAFQVVAVMAHASSPLQELNYEQLVNLFMDNGTIEDWADLVDEAAWSDRKVSLLAVRRENLITLELFNALVLDGARLKSAIRYTDAEGEALEALVIDDPTMLALVPFMPSVGASKLLAVKEMPTDQSFTPSQDNVFFGDYPLRLPFRVVIADSVDEALLAPLLDVLYSDRVTEALWESNFVPVPAPERRAILSRFE